MISIQDLTRQTGLTARTLRHYDAIGLLKPVSTTSGGHRLYSQEEVLKLQQIQFLKKLNFSLKEIKAILTDPDWDWAEGLRKQLACIREEQKNLRQIERVIQGLTNSYIMEGELKWSVIFELIQLMNQEAGMKQRFRKQYFDPEEYDLLYKLPRVDRTDPDSLEWVALIGQLRRHMDKEASSIDVQCVVRKMMDKVRETFGDEEEFIEKVWDIRKSSDRSREMNFYPLDPEFLDFIEEAVDIYLSTENK